MQKERENRIDLIRGLSLLLIFVGHSSFVFSEGVQHARGFADASELFVLMAGISAALAYYGRRGADALTLQLGKLLLRARKIYLVHVGLLLALISLFTVALAADLPYFDAASHLLGLSGFWTDPFGNLLSILLLRYMPGNFDILPMYVILIAYVPLFFFVYDRSRIVLFGLSVLLWLAAGFGHINIVNTALPEGHWYFDPLSWQLIFLIGLVIGIRIKTGQPALPYNRVMFSVAAFFCVMAIPVNILFHFHFVEPPSEPLYRALTSKTNDGILRLCNAVALVYVLWNIGLVKRLADGRLLRPVCVIGRHSMPVFVTGMLLSDLMTVLMGLRPSLGLAMQLLLMTAGLILQLAVGQRLEARKRGVERVRTPPAESAAGRAGDVPAATA